MDPENLQAKFEVRSFTHPWIHRSRIFKVTDCGTNRKRLCDFLLVHNSNLGPILHHFGDNAGLLCSRVTPPLFDPNFGGVPVAPDRPCWGRPEQRP